MRNQDLPWLRRLARKQRKARRDARALAHLAAFKLGLTRKPLAVRWNITSRCPNNCHYCNSHRISGPDATAAQVDLILDRIVRMRPIRISISGGEPLASPHFDRIVDRLHGAGISVIMNSSGRGIRDHADAVRKLELVQFSLDGPEDVCDRQRGPGTFAAVMDAVAFVRALGVGFSFAMTLTRHNAEVAHVRYMLDLARGLGAMVAFQPVKRVYGREDDFEASAPSATQMRAVVDFLEAGKRRGDPAVRNTAFGLRHIRDWPDLPAMRCTAGRMFVIVQADGNLVACDRVDHPLQRDVNLADGELADLLPRLEPPRCEGCGFCGAMELNGLDRLRLSTLWTLRRL